MFFVRLVHLIVFLLHAHCACFNYIQFNVLLITMFVLSTGKFNRQFLSNRDIIRAQVLCDMMALDKRDSTWDMAVATLGDKIITTPQAK